MERTTVMLPRELKRRSTIKSKELGISFGEFVRLSLTDELTRHNPVECDPLFEDSAVYHGAAPANISRNHDEILYDKTGD